MMSGVSRERLGRRKKGRKGVEGFWMLECRLERSGFSAHARDSTTKQSAGESKHIQFIHSCPGIIIQCVVGHNPSNAIIIIDGNMQTLEHGSDLSPSWEPS